MQIYTESAMQQKKKRKTKLKELPVCMWVPSPCIAVAVIIGVW